MFLIGKAISNILTIFFNLKSHFTNFRTWKSKNLVTESHILLIVELWIVILFILKGGTKTLLINFEK